MQDEYARTVSAVTEAFAGLTPELRKAARFILKHPEDVGLNSMRMLARQAGVKPATISRLSKALGFEAYEQLREPFRQRLRMSDAVFSSRFQGLQQRQPDETRMLFAAMREQELQSVAGSLSDEQFATLCAVVETLWASRRIFVLGLRGAYAPAFVFSYAHRLFSDKCHLLETRAGMLADQLRDIDKQDALLVISIPPYTQLTIDAAEFAAESDMQIVAITDSPLSPAARLAKHTLIAHSESTSFYHSLTGALAICQTLIALLVARSGEDTLNVVKDAEQRLQRINAYW